MNKFVVSTVRRGTQVTHMILLNFQVFFSKNVMQLQMQTENHKNSQATRRSRTNGLSVSLYFTVFNSV